MFTLSMLVLALPFAGQPAAEPVPASTLARKAVERSLPHLMEEGLKWKARTFTPKKTQCISCHHISLAVWAHHDAAAQGFAVDQHKLDTLSDWMIDFSSAKKYPDEMVDGFLDTVLLASESGTRSAQHRKAFELFQQMMAKQQRTDGSWMRQDSPNEPGFAIIPPGAKKDDTAKREAQEVDTMWALLGLNVLHRLGNDLTPTAQEQLGKQRSAALAFLKKAQGGTRSDWLAFRMLIERDLGDKANASHWRKVLVDQQNKDGGWGLVRGDASHIVVTGQALYALGMDGVRNDEAVVQRAWHYLVKVQRKDGSWTASSRVIADHRNYVTDNFGTAWATLGLIRTLPTPMASDSKER
jgi:hypothetical protein